MSLNTMINMLQKINGGKIVLIKIGAFYIAKGKDAELALIIYCVIGIGFIIVISKISGTTIKEIFSIDLEFIVTLFLMLPQVIIANIQGNKYKKEKLLKKMEKNSNKVEFEEISSNGKKRKGKIRA